MRSLHMELGDDDIVTAYRKMQVRYGDCSGDSGL